MKPVDITGSRFGRLVAMAPGASTPQGIAWQFTCDCGNQIVRLAKAVRSGDPSKKSCGCLQREIWSKRCSTMNYRHGMTDTPTWKTWSMMLDRCKNPNAPKFHHYGGRGITVCDRWLTFENFYADMGERPTDLTLDRINVDGNYEPANCRWATHKEQRANRRPTVKR